MRHRTTFTLLVLFFAGLGVLWWADYADIPTAEERRELSNRLLPDLVDTPVESVRRVEIESRDPSIRLTVARREGGGWQLRSPVDASADPNLVETLVKNLKDLRKSLDAGTIVGDPSPYGLDAPRATLKLYGVSSRNPLATLELGNAVRERVYVRTKGAKGIEVVDARLLGAVGKPPAEWRDRMLFRVPTFRVEGLSIEELDRKLEVKREDRKWRMLQPTSAPADDDKVEGLSAELAALRVVDGKVGFVADDVKDFAPYGLEKPSMTLTVTPFAGAGTPQVLKIGKPVPDHPDRRYAVRGDQDDVVVVDVKLLREAYPGPNALRSQSVVDLTRARVTGVRVEALDTVFDLVRSGDGWALRKPVSEKADNPAVEGLLARLIELKTSEFLDPTTVSNPKLDPPQIRIRVWQRPPGSTAATKDHSAGDGDPPGEVRVDLRLGRHDVLKRVVYGQIDKDSSLLALPDSILSVLPRNRFAFRDLTALAFNAAAIDQLTVERGGQSVTVQAGGSGQVSTKWQMVEPVKAPADEQAVTALVSLLSNLRAESWESDSVGDGKAFGFDAPLMRVRWATRSNPSADGTIAGTGRRSRTLRIGRPKEGKGTLYANIEGEAPVFSLAAGVVAVFEAELRSRAVLSFPSEKAERLVIRWPSRTLALSRQTNPSGGREWRPEPGYDPSGFNFGRVESLVQALSKLTTPKFYQYEGKFPEASGLATPRLTLQVWTEAQKSPAELRVGRVLGDTQALATNTTASEGAVFALPVNEVWNDLLRVPGRPGDLPDDVFAPAPSTAPATPAPEAAKTPG